MCSDTDEDIARYSVLHENEQLFASKYTLYLPSEEELKAFSGDAAVIELEDTHKHLADLSANFYGHPEKEISVFGIT